MNLSLPSIQFPNFSHTWLLLVFGWTILAVISFFSFWVAKRQALAVSKNLCKINSGVLVVLEFPWMIHVCGPRDMLGIRPTYDLDSSSELECVRGNCE